LTFCYQNTTHKRIVQIAQKKSAILSLEQQVRQDLNDEQQSTRQWC
jgi:hypothetical protein